MNVEMTHHIDASEPDERGLYSYFYEYDLYTFSDGPTSYIARSYADTPTEAHFLKRRRGSRETLLCARDLQEPMFAEALAYLGAAGKSELKWLSEKTGYISISIAGADAPPVGKGFWSYIWRRR